MWGSISQASPPLGIRPAERHQNNGVTPLDLDAQMKVTPQWLRLAGLVPEYFGVSETALHREEWRISNGKFGGP